MNDTEFLKLVPVLSRIPDEWEDHHFYRVITDRGMLAVLAVDVEEAEDAVTIYFGRVSCPEVERGSDDAPLRSPYPMSLAGPCSYLDATRVLHGDPCDPPMRAADSSPMPDIKVAFVACAATPGGWIDWGRSENFREQERIAREFEKRNNFLARADLLSEAALASR